MSDKKILIPNLGYVGTQDGFHILDKTEDGRFVTGKNGVVDIVSTGDEKVEFVSFGDSTLACVKSAIAYPVYYPLEPVNLERPVKAVLMDL
ncbi:MAG: HAD family phosphatase, partial [Acutalibacteraceae bacterium]